MQIAVSHTSLDFDALASQLGVTKLHPQARMAVCLPVLGNMRDYLTMHRSQLPLVQMKYLRTEAISKIFIVDCQHIDRLDPVVQELIAKGTPYSIFDHHQNDLQGLGAKAQADSIIEGLGACTTLLVEKIEKGKIKLSPFEATLLALGIYEDTGCLTYNSTTNRDAAAVAFLLRQGADLQVINEYMRPKFTDAQQALLQELVTGARLVNLGGNRVVFAAASCSDYIDGLATLTRKLTEIESAHAAFAAVQMRDKIYLVGRSDTPAIDVRAVVRLYGGDGHTGAGSAVIKNISGSCASDDKILSEGPVGAKFMSPGLEQPAKTRAQQASPLHSDEHRHPVAGEEHGRTHGRPYAGTPTQILADIENFLTEHVEPELTAEKIMSMPAKMILPSVSMDEAGKIMIRYNLDGLLVAEEGKIVGVIGKRDVDQALHHKLGHAPVSGFMSRPVITIPPDTVFSDIQSIMVRNNIGRLPVMGKTGELLGVVSRNDVLKILFNKTPDVGAGFASPVFMGGTESAPTENERMPSAADIKPQRDYTQVLAVHERLSALDPDTMWIFREIGNIAGQLNMSAYAVGGLVRDMILGLNQLDLDFVIEGSAITIAEKLTANHPDKFKLVNKHERFQTATISCLPDEQRTIDLSTARQEFYEHPAALPTVEPSLLKEDIFRRDFTINTLALALNPDQFGILIDYFHGLEDLQAGVVRVLHQFSFVEDPTRILRAARFAGRFSFKLDANTAELARHAIAMGIFDNLAGARMKEELRLILASPARLTALEILSALGAKLRYLDEELAYGNTEKKLMRRAEQVLKQFSRASDVGADPIRPRVDAIDPYIEQSWLVFLALLLSRLPLERLVRILGRLHLVNEDREMIIRGLSLDQEIIQLKKNAKRSEIYRIFHNAADVSLAIAACLAKPGSSGRRVIKLYLEELNGVHAELTGRDLLQLGFSEGPEIGKLLQELLNAKLDGIVRNRQEEVDFIKELQITPVS